MNVLDIFSGIGGFSIGLERAGMRTVAFCEIDPFCRLVLAGNWPSVPIFDDVRELSAAALAAAGVGTIDVIAGGFPCQDVSVAGARAGLDGARSGLWSEYARLIGEIRPRFIIVENVAGLLSGDRGRWFGRVLGDLAALGYDAEWHCVPAAAVGAPHLRDRLWLVAYRDGSDLRLDEQRHARRRDDVQHGGNAEPGHDGAARVDPDADRGRREVERPRNLEGSKAPRKMVPTPQAHDHRSGKGFDPSGRGHSPQLRHLTGGLLNPAWVLWLMGFPAGHLQSALSAMRSSRRSPKRSDWRS